MRTEAARKARRNAGFLRRAGVLGMEDHDAIDDAAMS